MSRQRDLPPTASFAQSTGGGRLHAPSAERNAEAICALVADHAPELGRALEIASGTGQHMVKLAARLPALEWQPSDIDPERRRSIDAWLGEAALSNVHPAIDLNAATPGWSTNHGGQDVILLVNLLHLISTPEATTVISEVAKALAPGGIFVLYGPFLRDGETTSEGDASFDASLRAQDPEIGYKDNWDIIDWLQAQFLDLVEVVEMPANNLAFVARKPGGV